ncbi:pyrroloquinoline quinone biosynthesis protein PqqB [Prauserella sp. PE36]|uniref:pyrroloquinoline quinone biosynthesis protein PqqB n=1 Tax=Prauserella sp. PE36 TaxID=1504709 RepID=UPI000DE4FA3F|nr:pyrroloquinoline quinone biosynthesis protein PqqB [Prauserella sp. PE36]RBM23077.1 pyrroloquinoline quinone biosynthesis protein PqqB [Prauserella sp. PE36]
MRVILLGTAAGGGVPQWNCACANCEAVRDGSAPARTQDCLAVSADGRAWYLLNASPDVRTQLTSCAALAPGPGPRETPLRGVLLTDGELDHTLGLFQLKEAAGLRVWAPGAVAATVPAREIAGRYHGWEWPRLRERFELDGLVVTVFPVSGKRPKYAGDSTLDGPWVVAYRIEDPATGGSLVYAPCVAQWPAGFDEFCAGASCVLLDGSFFAPDEMAGATAGGVGSGAQLAMGHLPMAGEHGSLARIRRSRGTRWLYTHVNNTNPVLNPASPEHAALLEAGAELPPDATELLL